MDDKPFSNLSPWKKTLKTSRLLACNQVSMVYNVCRIDRQLVYWMTMCFNFVMLAMFIRVMCITRCSEYFFCFYPEHRSILEAMASWHLDWLREDRLVMLTEYLLQKARYWQCISWQYNYLEQTIKWLPHPVWSGLYASYIPCHMEPICAKWVISCHKVISFAGSWWRGSMQLL